MSHEIYEVDNIQFLLSNYVSFPKAERINFYLNLINIPFQLSDLEKKFGSFLTGFSLQLKDSNEKEFDGNETITITKETEVCFFYMEYRILFFLDLSQSLLMYDYEEKIINIEKIETYLKIIIERFLKFNKTIYNLKFEKILFQPKIVISFASATNEDELNILCHEIYFDLQNFNKYYEFLIKKLKTTIMNFANKKMMTIPPLTSMNGYPQIAQQNPGNLNSYIKTQMMYLNKIFEHSLYILDLLPRNASPLLFLLTDSNICLSKIGKYNNILMQLGRVDLTTHVIDLFSQNYTSNLSSPAYINSVAIMKYISKFTSGNYFSETHLNDCLNIYRETVRNKYSYTGSNMINFQVKTQKPCMKEVTQGCSSDNKEETIKCRSCNHSICIFFCKKPYHIIRNQPQLKIDNEFIAKFCSIKQCKNLGYNIHSIDKFAAQSDTRILQSEIFETYQLRVPIDLITEARIRESFYLKKDVSSISTFNCYYINIFPEIQIVYAVHPKKTKEQSNSDLNTSECDEYTIKIMINAPFAVFNALKLEYLKNSHEIVTTQSMKTNVELLLNFIKEVMCTDKLLSFFCANFSDDKDFQSEKDNFISNNKLLWDLIGNLSIHSWHRFFNVDIIELLNKNVVNEVLDDDLMMTFIRKDSKFPNQSTKSKGFIENQIYKFFDIVKRDLNFGIKLIPKSSNNSNKKYINGFMLLKFNWLCENLCLISLGFFQAFNHTRARFKQKFIEEITHSTENNDISIEISKRHLTFLLSNEISSSISHTHTSATGHPSKPMKKKNIENYYFQKDLENFKNQCGSIFTYRASKKLINSYLIKKVASYSSPWQFSILQNIKSLISQRIQENFSILNWNNDTVTLCSKIQVTKIKSLDELKKTILRSCLLLYTITLNSNKEEFTTEFLIEPNSGFVLWKVNDTIAKIYDEKNFYNAITNYFKNSENKITEWIKVYSNVIKDALGGKLKEDNFSKQTRRNFYICYLNQNIKELNENIDQYRNELKDFYSNFQAPKRNNFTIDSFIRTLTFICEKQYDILGNTTKITWDNTKISSDNVKRFCYCIHSFFEGFKDYSISNEDNYIYYGKLFAKTTCIFVAIPSKAKLLQHILQVNEDKEHDLRLKIRFYYLTIDTLKPIDKTLHDILNEKEPLKTFTLPKEDDSLIINTATNQIGNSPNLNNVPITNSNTNSNTNYFLSFWENQFPTIPIITETIKDNMTFNTSINSFLPKFYSYLDFFFDIIIKSNNFSSYLFYMNTGIDTVLKNCYSFSINYSLTKILNKDKEGHDFIINKFDEITKAFFIPLSNNFYCNEKPSYDDTDHDQDSDIGVNPFLYTAQDVDSKYSFIMELIIVIHDEQHLVNLLNIDQIEILLSKLNWQNDESVELMVIYYFIPAAEDIFTEISKESYVDQSMALSIRNKNNYSIYYNNNHSNETTKQIPVFIESEKEDFFIRINPKMKKLIENFDKNLHSLHNLIEIENLRLKINLSKELDPLDFSQGFALMKKIMDKYFYKTRECFIFISNDNIYEYLKFEMIKESKVYTIDFSKENHLICEFNKFLNQAYDTKTIETYKLPVWLTLSINKNSCNGGRRTSLGNINNEQIYIEIKWFRFFPMVPQLHEIAEINMMLVKIIEMKINNINQRIMIDHLKESNEYHFNSNRLHFNDDNCVIDERKKDDSFFFKKDMEKSFKNPINNTFTIESNIDEVYKLIKEEFNSHFNIKNITDYYKMTSNLEGEEDQIFIIKILIADESKGSSFITNESSKSVRKSKNDLGNSPRRIGTQQSNKYQLLVEKKNLIIQLYGIVQPSKVIIKRIKDIVTEKTLLAKLLHYIELLKNTKEIKLLPEYEILNPKLYKGGVKTILEKKKIENSKQIEDVLKKFYEIAKQSWRMLYSNADGIAKLDIELMLYFTDKISLPILFPKFSTLTELNKIYFYNLAKFYQLFRGSKMKMIEYEESRCIRILIPGELSNVFMSNRGISLNEMNYAFLITVRNEGDDYEEYYANTFELLRRKDIEIPRENLSESIAKKEEIALMIYKFLEDLLYVSHLIFVKKK